jgi:DivIVA domain-containing protein
VADFFLIVVAALIVAGLVFGVVAFSTGRDAGLTDAAPPGAPSDLPADRPLDADDLAAARFDTALRGYRMDQVDALLARAAHDVRELREYADGLERELGIERPEPDGSERPHLDAPWPVAGGPEERLPERDLDAPWQSADGADRQGRGAGERGVDAPWRPDPDERHEPSRLDAPWQTPDGVDAPWQAPGGGRA